MQNRVRWLDAKSEIHRLCVAAIARRVGKLSVYSDGGDALKVLPPFDARAVGRFERKVKKAALSAALSSLFAPRRDGTIDDILLVRYAKTHGRYSEYRVDFRFRGAGPLELMLSIK